VARRSSRANISFVTHAWERGRMAPSKSHRIPAADAAYTTWGTASDRRLQYEWSWRTSVPGCGPRSELPSGRSYERPMRHTSSNVAADSESPTSPAGSPVPHIARSSAEASSTLVTGQAGLHQEREPRRAAEMLHPSGPSGHFGAWHTCRLELACGQGRSNVDPTDRRLKGPVGKEALES
jgi:hypothetical protein